MAKRMGATTFEFDSSHVPMLSQPDFGARRDPQGRQRLTKRGSEPLTGAKLYFR